MWRWRDSWPNCWLNRETTCSSSPSRWKTMGLGRREPPVARPARPPCAGTTLLCPEEQRAFTGFLEGVRNADAMLGVLSESLSKHAPGALLAMYGDHLPSFPQTFRSLGFVDRRSDYLLWRAGNFGAGMRKDLAAQHLMGDILAFRQNSRDWRLPG